ncbi:hypothetical protein [Legionella cherrii]|uniref:Ankyrin repeat-containing protein n=1 Tax=Legionella cherrii TaxID=28084 RepID=A0A0W0S9Q7_9GAMM|nr:hypothetical protein [Legionella cherrii]KTC79796.1 ankyrin repeat-containing protein [Legionella cherrii]VEB37996.1 ankyrin repeat-containing protein [Legionella cherrii]
MVQLCCQFDYASIEAIALGDFLSIFLVKTTSEQVVRYLVYNNFNRFLKFLNIMTYNFFNKEAFGISKEDKLKRFFNKFPENEFWRFFVERIRYDFRQQLYRKLFAKMSAIPEEKAEEIPVSIIADFVRDLTIGDVYQLAEQLGDHEALTGLNNLLHVQDRKGERIVPLFNKHQGWLGFEDNEPGYLLNVTNGLCFAIAHMLSGKPFTLGFLKELHKTCTKDVHQMLDQTPGEFRSRGASWQMDLKTDSLEGLIETIDYLKSVEAKMGTSGLDISIQTKDGVEFISSFCNEDTHSLADKIWSNLKAGAVIYYNAREENKIDSNSFLDEVCSAHIQQLEEALENAVTKQEKLTALFTYLKHDVLHHPFQDGVGRTYSMVLLQYLLMRDNFLPVLFLNSNIIPGYSVKELVDEYLRAEKEMERILDFPQYISSEEMATPNVDTEMLLSTASAEEKDIFIKALTQFKEIKRCYLDWNNSQANETPAFQNTKV